MYADSTLQWIDDYSQYVAPDGTQYPWDFPKDQIAGLHRVIETLKPTDPYAVIVGFHIDNTYTQVWEVRSMTDDERAAYRQGLVTGLAALRYAAQNGGAIIDGDRYRTDPESRQALSDCLLAATLDPSFTVDYKMDNETWKTLDKAGIINVWVKGAAFVQKCFNAEKAVKAKIAEYDTMAQIVAAFNQAMA